MNKTIILLILVLASLVEVESFFCITQRCKNARVMAAARRRRAAARRRRADFKKWKAARRRRAALKKLKAARWRRSGRRRRSGRSR